MCWLVAHHWHLLSRIGKWVWIARWPGQLSEREQAVLGGPLDLHHDHDWLLFGPCFFRFDYPMTVWVGTLTMFSFPQLCCTTSVCAPNFGFHLDTATRCYCYNHFHLLLLQSQHLYCSKMEFLRNPLGQLPICYASAKLCAIHHKTAPFHRYLTSLGSRSWQLSTWSSHASGWQKVYPWEADKWPDGG